MAKKDSVKMELKVSPSKLQRAWHCTGSPKLSEGMEMAPGPWAEKGKRAHLAVLEAVKELDAEHVFNIATPEADKIEDVQKWKAHAQAILDFMAKGGFHDHEVEKFLTLKPLGMLLSGREGEHCADLVWKDTEDQIHLLDYKSGKDPVEPLGSNLQFFSYAWGLLNVNDGSGLWMHLYQPEVNTEVESIWADRHNVETFGEECKAKMEEVQRGGELAEGDWCKWCPAKKICPLKKDAKEQKQNDKEQMTLANNDALAGGKPVIVEVPAKLGGGSLVVMGQAAITKAEDLLGQVDRIVNVGIFDKAGAENLARLLKEITSFETTFTNNKVEVKRPYADLLATVEEKAKICLKPLAEAKSKAKVGLQKFLDDDLAKQQKLAEAKPVPAATGGRPAPAAPAPAAMKVAGMKSATVNTFTISDLSKVPARYVRRYEGDLEISGKVEVAVVWVDVALINTDYEAKKLDKATWFKVNKSSKVSA